MNTSRSDERKPTVDLTLGERMVMAARMMAAEHIRQECDDAGVDLAQVQRELRARVVRQDLFEPLPSQPARPANPFADAVPIALPQRVKAKRKPPSRTIAEIDAEIDLAIDSRPKREAA